jgi:hypothetical protein
VRVGQRRDTPETVALRLACDAERGAVMLPLLDDVLFDDDLHAMAYRALRDAGGDVHAAIEAAGPGEADLLSRLAAQDETGVPADVRRILLRLAGQREVQRLRMELRSGGDPADLQPSLSWLLTRLEAVGPDSRPDPAAEDQLLTWLSERAEERS